MILFTPRISLFVRQTFSKNLREFTSRRNVNSKLLCRILLQPGFCLFATPNFELAIQRTDRIDENQKQDCILGLVQVANAPCNRNNRQMNQIRIERSSADFADDANAEELCDKTLAGQKRNEEKAIQ